MRVESIDTWRDGNGAQSFHSISFAITVAIYIDVLFSVFGAQAKMIFKSRRHVNVDGFNVSDRDLTKGQT